jgi:hypothetical protein
MRALRAALARSGSDARALTISLLKHGEISGAGSPCGGRDIGVAAVHADPARNRCRPGKTIEGSSTQQLKKADLKTAWHGI